ncbi:MAG TPA: hypothetical protein VE032_01975 [Actinomycetota bacterium]|nr:hypothetical protein [Actinomycetota bacterium]
MPATDDLAARRNPDGGYGPVPRAGSEPEPTALAALALDDDAAASWLEAAQGDDGSVGMRAGAVFRDVTAPAVLAMRDPAAQRAGVGWILASRARAEPSTDALPHDPALRGWAWTSDTFGWAEPTAWSVLALRVMGHDGPEVDDGIAVLRDRACVGGGWNYGNRIVLDEELPPFVQTTGIALIALHGLDEPMVATAADRLATIWPHEADGLLSLALAAAALRTIGHRSAAEVARRLGERQAAAADADTIALAWFVIALGDGLERLAVT